MLRRNAGTLFRIGAGGLLVFVIFRQVGTGAVWQALRTVAPGWVAGAVALAALAVVISACRWGLLLRAAGLDLPFRRHLTLYLVGLFASNFLPSSIGGDVVRLWSVGRDSGRMAAATASVVAERVTGGWALGAFALIALPLGGPAAAYLRPSVVILVSVMALFSALMLTPAWVSALSGLAARRSWTRAATGLQQGAEALAAYRRQPRVLAATAAWAVIFQTTVAGVNYCLFRGLGFTIGPLACAGLTALVLAATTVPISVGGLGVREAAYVALFGNLGVPSRSALAASLLFLAAVTLVSLPGGIALALGQTPIPVREVDRP